MESALQIPCGKTSLTGENGAHLSEKKEMQLARNRENKQLHSLGRNVHKRKRLRESKEEEKQKESTRKK